MSRQRSEDARRGRRIQGVSPLLHPPCFQPQSAGWELNHTRNCCQCSKQCIFYLKALAGLKTLTDKSPEKRLEPLQEHLTFPALIYLRFILHSWLFKMICLFCDDVGLWMILLTGSQAWPKITPSLYWTMSPLYIQEYAWRTSFWWKTCWGMFSQISVGTIFPSPFFQFLSSSGG